jgi:predicted Zn-dependent protease
VADALFALAEGEVSEVYRQGDDAWVYRLVKRAPSAVPAFAEARADVERDIVAQKARERALGAARLRLAELRGGEAAEAVAARAKGAVRDTAYFSRRDFVAEGGVKAELLKDAFGQAAGAVGGPAVAPDGRILLWKVGGVLPASREDFARDKDAVVQRLRSSKKDLLFEAWMEDLRRARAVKVNDALIGVL